MPTIPVPGSSQAFPSDYRRAAEAAACGRPGQGLQWVNTPVLVEAIERFEQGRLPRSLALWLSAVLELESPESRPLRRRGC